MSCDSCIMRPANAIKMLSVPFSICNFNLLLVNGNARKCWTESTAQKGKGSKQGGRRRQDETGAPEKGKEDVLESREEKESGSERERKGGEWRGSGGGGVSTGLDKGGGRKQEEGYNAAVFSVSRVPRLGSPDWFAGAPRVCLRHGLAF